MFFKTQSESMSHLFYQCFYSQEFWVEVSLLIYRNRSTPILEDMVLFLNCNTGSQSANNALKLIHLVSKYHIHKITPNIHLFFAKLQYLFELSKITKNKKAIENSHIIREIIFSKTNKMWAYYVQVHIS